MTKSANLWSFGILRTEPSNGNPSANFVYKVPSIRPPLSVNLFISIMSPNISHSGRQALHPYSSQPASEWSTGLCGCCEDCSNCFVTFCCPCVTFGRIVEVVDRGQTSCVCGALICYALAPLCCACCLYTFTTRTKLRALYSLPEDPCPDFCIHLCCSCCGFCQEYRELKNHGIDPAIGWIANVQRMNDGITAPPFVAPGMTR